jgi:hypothetical protein
VLGTAAYASPRRRASPRSTSRTGRSPACRSCAAFSRADPANGRAQLFNEQETGSFTPGTSSSSALARAHRGLRSAAVRKSVGSSEDSAKHRPYEVTYPKYRPCVRLRNQEVPVGRIEKRSGSSLCDPELYLVAQAHPGKACPDKPSDPLGHHLQYERPLIRSTATKARHLRQRLAVDLRPRLPLHKAPGCKPA